MTIGYYSLENYGLVAMVLLTIWVALCPP